MTIQRYNERLPNSFMRMFIHTVQEELGSYSLPMLLRNSGLEHYVTDIPPNNDRLETYISEYANIQKIIRDYYGNGARGSLTRIGHGLWDHILSDTSLLDRIRLHFFRILPSSRGFVMILEFLAKLPKRQVKDYSITIIDSTLLFIDHSSEITYGQVTDESICWTTIGTIQAAFKWLKNQDVKVIETSCIAAGAEACKFEVHF